LFVNAIETVSLFTRPILFISRYYGSTTVFPGSATLFFVNKDGWALTCRHVLESLLFTDPLSIKREKFRQELNNTTLSIKDLESKYDYKDGAIFELKAYLQNCIEGNLNLRYFYHSSLDLALIKFDHFDRLLCDNFPVFAEHDDHLKQGKFLCRLGYPFPEFTNHIYNSTIDTIEWTDDVGSNYTPSFPIEGMVTRNLLKMDTNNKPYIYGFELSTPGLRGQSGGPAFDSDGRIWGMQSATNHLDLDFDVNLEVNRNGVKKVVNESAFLHVGHCIHVSVIKEFMKSNNVQFNIG